MPAESAHAARLSSALLAIAALTISCGDKARESQGSPVVVLDASTPEIRFAIPEFSLVDQGARPFARADMAGKIWIVDFIFTNCPTICPNLTKKMATLHDAMAADDGVRFLSISVDPENDTPAKLSEFVAKHGRVSPRWSLLTGPADEVERTVLRGFKTAMSKDNAGNLAHGEKFVLVDRAQTIVGFFDADEEGFARLRASIERLR